MAVRHGYGKIAGTDALVFAYDTGDTSNSYKGEPTTNQYTNPDFSNGTSGWTFSSWDGNISYTTATIPGPYGKDVTALKLTKNASSAYSHFHQSNSGKYTTGNQYTLSAWVKGSGTLRGNSQWGGVEQSFVLTGDWQYINYTVTAPNDSSYPYWAAETLTTGTVMYMTYAQSEQKSHATQFVNGTRSSTQGLLDLTGNSTIDISPTSFNSNAEIEYDGSNDYIYVGSKTWSFPNGATVEQIIKPLTLNLQQGFFTLNGPGSYINFWMPSNNTMRWEVIGTTSQGYSTVNCTTVFQTGQYYHVVGTFNGTTTNIYINGIEENSQTMTNQPTSMTAQMDIGRYDTSYPSSAQIPVTKFYTRPLTAAEIKNNYNQYRTRFNI